MVTDPHFDNFTLRLGVIEAAEARETSIVGRGARVSVCLRRALGTPDGERRLRHAAAS
jgi:hypothetical protein